MCRVVRSIENLSRCGCVDINGLLVKGGRNVINTTQCGFRKGLDRDDAISILQQVLNIYWKNNKSLYLVFVDLKKAYDFVPRVILWLVLKKAGLPEKIINMLKNLHLNSVAKLRLDGVVIDDIINLDSGLKQGCGGAPMLFVVYLRRL